MKTVYVYQIDNLSGSTVDLMKVDMPEFPGIKWLVTRIMTPIKHRNEGYATNVLQMVLKDADKEGETLILSVSPEEPNIDINRLIEFYERYEFVYQSNDIMTRNPSG